MFKVNNKNTRMTLPSKTFINLHLLHCRTTLTNYRFVKLPLFSVKELTPIAHGRLREKEMGKR